MGVLDLKSLMTAINKYPSLGMSDYASLFQYYLRKIISFWEP